MGLAFLSLVSQSRPTKLSALDSLCGSGVSLGARRSQQSEMVNHLKALIRYALFPTNFCVAIAVACLALERQWHPGLVLAGITLVTVAVILVAERVSPFHEVWNEARGDVGTDLLHATLSQLLLPFLLGIAIQAAIITFAADAASGTYTGVWPRQLTMFLQVPLALLVTQFGEYWWHRLAHESPFFWRFHATHHSPRRLYWLNAGRFHPIDTAIAVSISAGTLGLLGAGPEVILVMTAWIIVHGLYQHCNIDLRLGPLNYIFSMAELHRWHHSLHLEEANNNYGNNIILWDIVFGTMYWPKDRQPSAKIGIDMPSFPESFWGQIKSPFEWARLNDKEE